MSTTADTATRTGRHAEAARRAQASCGQKHASARSGRCPTHRRGPRTAFPQVTSGARPGSARRSVGSSSYYDPTTAQFTTVDPLVAITHEPYGYTHGNPANADDPWGLGCSVLESAASFFTGNVFRPKPCAKEREVVERAGREIQKGKRFMVRNGPEATVRICPIFGCVEVRASLKTGLGARAGAGVAYGVGVNVGAPGDSCTVGTSEMFIDFGRGPVSLGGSTRKGADDEGWDSDFDIGFSPGEEGWNVTAGAVRWDWTFGW